MKHKAVINTCYGGFGLSRAAVKRYYELVHPEITLWFYYWDYDQSGYRLIDKEDSDKEVDLTLTAYYGDTIKTDHFSSDHPWKDSEYVYLEYGLSRTDPILIQVVEELGSGRASGRCAELSVVEFEGPKFRICEYDGAEWIETPETIDWDIIDE